MVEAFYAPEPVIEKTKITRADIKKIFFETLNDFAIDSNWVELKSSKIKNDSTLNYSVKIPQDLPLLLVVNDLTKNYRYNNIESTSDEKKINGATLFKVVVDDEERLNAKLVHSSNSERQESKAAFIVEDAYELSERNLKRLLDFGYPFSVILTPSLESELFKDKITVAGKDYVLILNDEIDDDKFIMEEGFAKKKIAAAVSSILSSFPDSKMFFVDEDSDLYQSAIFNFIEDEFGKRSIRLRLKSEFKSLNGISSEETKSLFDFYKNKNDIPKTFFITSQNFLPLREDLIKFRKRGNIIAKISDL